MRGLGSWASDTDETVQLREQMIDALVQAGDITDERWRQAFAAVPRHALIPRYYRPDNYHEIYATKAADHSMWIRSVYSDETLITQKTPSTVTSSGTMPGLVATMLHALDVCDHHRVLQVGTGTGYTAGLLCERLGSYHVTTVDIAHVISCARTATEHHSRCTTLGPRDTFYQQHMRFFLAVALHDVSVGQHGPCLDDLIIRDDTGSSARLDSTRDGSFLVAETGSRALWGEVEQLHDLWHDCRQPHRERFGLSISNERQWVWLDSPDSRYTWELPA